MVPDGTDQKQWQGYWNKCKGYDSTEMPGYYCIEFYSTENPGFMKYFFKAGPKLEMIRRMRNEWINHPVLNRSGLAHQVWDDDSPNKLRRRLEQRAVRATFKEDEKERILKAVKDFYDQVKECLK
jgi:hypothetical protein